MTTENYTIDDMLGTDTLSIIFGYLNWKDILRARVSKKWQEAARQTQVPMAIGDEAFQAEDVYFYDDPPDIFVQNRETAVALAWISLALPLLPSLSFDFYRPGQTRYSVVRGEDAGPEPESIPASLHSIFPPPPVTAPVDLSPIANFRGLRHLRFRTVAPDWCRLIGRYPFFFEFKNLEILELVNAHRLKFDLADLAGLPNLQRLRVELFPPCCTGNLESVRVLRRSLRELCLAKCGDIHGSIHDLADFPNLSILNLIGTQVTGDVYSISSADFPSLETLSLSREMYGGSEIDRISDAERIVLATYFLRKRGISLSSDWTYPFSWWLKSDSPDHYESLPNLRPPFQVELVDAGPRIGWRWTNGSRIDGGCEVNWLDSDPPSPSENGYEKYLQDVEQIQSNVVFYRGYNRPPTEQEYRALSESKYNDDNGGNDVLDFWAGDLLEE